MRREVITGDKDIVSALQRALAKRIGRETVQYVSNIAKYYEIIHYKLAEPLSRLNNSILKIIDEPDKNKTDKNETYHHNPQHINMGNVCFSAKRYRGNC